MALNPRQIAFITRLKSFGNTIEQLYGEAYSLKESYEEEFDDAQDHSLLTSNDDLELEYYFDSADVKAAINQVAGNFQNFWVGSAVGTREYGKDIRRIK